MLAALVPTFALSASLPAGAYASGPRTAPSGPQSVSAFFACRSAAAGELRATTAAILRSIVDKRLLTRLLSVGNSAPWQPNAWLCVAVALSMSLGASVPLSTLFEPGALGAPARSVEGAPAAFFGSSAWAVLQAAVAQAHFNVGATELLLHVLGSLLRAAATPHIDAQAVRFVPGVASATRELRRALADLPPQAARAPTAGSEENVIIRLAGGFVLNLEQPFSAAHRVGLLFSLPGSTMLDTLVGMLLATCLAQERVAL